MWEDATITAVYRTARNFLRRQQRLVALLIVMGHFTFLFHRSLVVALESFLDVSAKIALLRDQLLYQCFALTTHEVEAGLLFCASSGY